MTTSLPAPRERYSNAAAGFGPARAARPSHYPRPVEPVSVPVDTTGETGRDHRENGQRVGVRFRRGSRARDLSCFLYRRRCRDRPSVHGGDTDGGDAN